MNEQDLREIAAAYLQLAGGRLHPLARIDIDFVYRLARDRLDYIEFACEHPGEYPTLERLFPQAQANAIGFGSVP